MHTRELTNNLNKNVASVRRGSLTRDNYISSLPVEHTSYAYEKEGVVAYTYINRRGYPSLMLFVGRGNKPTVHSAYHTEDDRIKALENTLTNIRHHQDRIESRRIERKNGQHTLKVGDILVSSWGYDQTNIDYYQVVKLVGTKMVDIASIRATVVGNHGTYDMVMPLKDGFYTPRYEGDTWKTGTLRRRVCPNTNSVSINTYASAYPWNGKPDDETNSMFGR